MRNILGAATAIAIALTTTSTTQAWTPGTTTKALAVFAGKRPLSPHAQCVLKRMGPSRGARSMTNAELWCNQHHDVLTEKSAELASQK